MIKFSRSNEKYGCFSNFYPCSVEYGGIVYPNSECAWQSLKTLDMEKRKKFATYKAAGAKKMGRRVELRSDWEEVKYQLMVNVCYAKFSQNKELKSILQATGEEELIENTTACRVCRLRFWRSIRYTQKRRQRQWRKPVRKCTRQILESE